MSSTGGRRWCAYHREWERAPICEHGRTKKLVGYAIDPHHPGHVWGCDHRRDLPVVAKAGS